MRDEIVGATGRALLLIAAVALAPASAQSPLTVSNGMLRLTVTPSAAGNRPGEITELARTDSLVPDIAGAGIFCGLKSGSYVPVPGTLASPDSLTLIFSSPSMAPLSGGGSLPIAYRCTYRLDGARVRLSIVAYPTAPVALVDGLELDYNLTGSQRIAVSNHFRSRELAIASPQWTGDDCHLDTRIVCQRPNGYLAFLMQNPAWTTWRVEPAGSATVYLKQFLLQSEPPISYGDPTFIATERIHSFLVPGDTITRELTIGLSTSEPLADQAYFSPHPSAYDQTMAVMWDEISGFTSDVAADSSSGNIIDQYVLRLLMRRPAMKMNYLISYDLFGAWFEIPWPRPANRWEQHGPARIATDAPEELRQWLRDIETGSHPWGARMSLGSHAYHHDRYIDSVTLLYHEFGTDDSLTNRMLFEALVADMGTIGLTASSRRSIRFPGFKYSNSALRSAALSGHTYYDNGKRYYTGVLSFFLSMYTYAGHRIWGTNTCWWGDYSTRSFDINPGRPFEYMDYPLAQGKVCLTGGHPGGVFNYCHIDSTLTGLNRADSMYLLAQTKYPAMGWLFPDEISATLDELYQLGSLSQSIIGDTLTFGFHGALSRSQTVVVPLASSAVQVTVRVDSAPAAGIVRNNKLYVVLPTLPAAHHEVTITGGQYGTRARALGNRRSSGLTLFANARVLGVQHTATEPGMALTIVLFDQAGRRVWSTRTRTQHASGMVCLPTPRIAAGRYVMNVTLANGLRTSHAVHIAD